jgi:hypothetical protein
LAALQARLAQLQKDLAAPRPPPPAAAAAAARHAAAARAEELTRRGDDAPTALALGGVDGPGEEWEAAIREEDHFVGVGAHLAAIGVQRRDETMRLKARVLALQQTIEGTRHMLGLPFEPAQKGGAGGTAVGLADAAAKVLRVAQRMPTVEALLEEAARAHEVFAKRLNELGGAERIPGFHELIGERGVVR